MIKNQVKMVVVGCLILCSIFARNRLSVGLRPDPLGELPRPSSWIKGKGGERGDGRGGEGEKGRNIRVGEDGKEGAGKGRV